MTAPPKNATLLLADATTANACDPEAQLLPRDVNATVSLIDEKAMTPCQA
jgi:hypothetical protein